MKSAHNLENDFYARNWIGPQATELDFLGQLAATNLLSASMVLMEGVSSLPSPTGNSFPSATPTPPSEAAGGSVIRPPVLVTLTVVSWVLGVANASFFWLRYRQERRTQRDRARESLH